jgi:hypothetical protein
MLYLCINSRAPKRKLINPNTLIVFLTVSNTMEPFKVPTLNLEPLAPTAATAHPFQIDDLTPISPSPPLVPNVRIIIPLERVPQEADFSRRLTRKKKILLGVGVVFANALLLGACTLTVARVFNPEAWWMGFIFGLALALGLDCFVYFSLKER